jgi:hypothetical protein
VNEQRGFARRDFESFGRDDAAIRPDETIIDAVGEEPTQAASVIGAVGQ